MKSNIAFRTSQMLAFVSEAVKLCTGDGDFCGVFAEMTGSSARSFWGRCLTLNLRSLLGLAVVVPPEDALHSSRRQSTF